MKTRRAYRLATAMFLPLLLLVVGCEVGGGGMIGDDFTQGEAYRIDCFVPEGAAQMMFKTHGALEDAGTVEGDPLPSEEEPSTGVVYRVFEGEKGAMALRVELAPGSGSRIAEGTFTVLGGSGAYARLERQGDFYATLVERGEPIEVFEGRLNGRQ